MAASARWPGGEYGQQQEHVGLGSVPLRCSWKPIYAGRTPFIVSKTNIVKPDHHFPLTCSCLCWSLKLQRGRMRERDCVCVCGVCVCVCMCARENGSSVHVCVVLSQSSHRGYTLSLHTWCHASHRLSGSILTVAIHAERPRSLENLLCSRPKTEFILRISALTYFHTRKNWVIPVFDLSVLQCQSENSDLQPHHS